MLTGHKESDMKKLHIEAPFITIYVPKWKQCPWTPIFLLARMLFYTRCSRMSWLELFFLYNHDLFFLWDTLFFCFKKPFWFMVHMLSRIKGYSNKANSNVILVHSCTKKFQVTYRQFKYWNGLHMARIMSPLLKEAL